MRGRVPRYGGRGVGRAASSSRRSRRAWARILQRGLGQGEQEFGVLQGGEDREALLAGEEDDGRTRQQVIPDPGPGLPVQLGAPLLSQEELEQGIRQRDEDHLIHDEGKGPGGEVGQIPEALELPVALLNGGGQVVLVPAGGGARRPQGLRKTVPDSN